MLFAYNDGKYEMVRPPENAKLGQRILLENDDTIVVNPEFDKA